MSRPRFPERVCANEDCGAYFLPKKADQATCSIPCRNAVTARKSAAKRGDSLRGRRRTGTGRYPKQGGRYAHRANAEELMGRPLAPGEVVHHLNGDKTDFSKFNVINVSSQKEHQRMEKRGRDRARARGQNV